MTPTTYSVLMPLLLLIAGILMAVIGFFLKQLVDQLKALNVTVNDMRNNLGVLANDHDNLKDDVKGLDVRMRNFETYKNGKG